MVCRMQACTSHARRTVLLDHNVRNREELAAQQEPCYSEGQNQVEGLAYDVQYERLTTLELVCHLFEVGLKTDAGECQSKAPGLELF